MLIFLSKPLYSNTHILYISTNNAWARKQSNSITSLHNQQTAYLMAWYKKPPFYSDLLPPFQSLIIRESAFNEAELTSPSPTDELTKEEPDLPLCSTCVRLWSSRHYKALAHLHYSIDDTSFCSELSFEWHQRSLGSCPFPDDRKLANVVPV